VSVLLSVCNKCKKVLARHNPTLQPYWSPPPCTGPPTGAPLQFCRGEPPAGCLRGNTNGVRKHLRLDRTMYIRWTMYIRCITRTMYYQICITRYVLPDMYYQNHVLPEPCIYGVYTVFLTWIHRICIGLARTIYIYGKYTVFLAGRSSNIRSYLLYIYGPGQL